MGGCLLRADSVQEELYKSATTVPATSDPVWKTSAAVEMSAVPVATADAA